MNTYTSHRKFTVGIAGPSRAGKTTLSLKVKENFNHTILVHQDGFCKNVVDVPKTPDMGHFWDDSDSLDLEELKLHLERISASPSQFCSDCLDSKGPTTSGGVDCTRVVDDHLVIVEGTQVLTMEFLQDRLSLKVFLDEHEPICAERRSRKQCCFPETLDSYIPDVPGYWEKYCWPVFLKRKAEIKQRIKSGEDIVCLTPGQEMEALVERITQEIRTRRSSDAPGMEA